MNSKQLRSAVKSLNAWAKDAPPIGGFVPPLGTSGRICINCKEPDKCLIMRRCLDTDERKSYIKKYGKEPVR